MANNLIDYLPSFYTEIREMVEIQSDASAEMDLLESNIDGLVNQCFVQTATWGLKLWEKVLGIPIDESKDAAYRRSVIKSKLRGYGTVTQSLMQSVAQSYDNGEISVIEHPEAYSFEVKFIGTLGLPPNIDDLKAAIEVIKPAHLAVTYSYRFLTVSEVNNLTIDQLSTRELTNFAPFL